MIPYILIIVGCLAAAFGLIGLIMIALLPFTRATQVVFKRKDDFLFYENAKGRKLLKSQIHFLLNIFFPLFIGGVLSVLAGFYIGFSDRGKDFWLYDTFFEVAEQSNHNDKITKDGKYLDNDGQEHSDYIEVRGTDLYLRGKPYDGIDALKKAVGEIDPGNEVVVVDYFAVSSVYHSVIDMLDDLGFRHIEERY